MIHIRSLNQRITLFLILPVTILLLAMGAVAFDLARNVFLEEWTDATILRLQRAAHHVDMRLDAPKKWIRIHQEATTSPEGPAIQTAILQQLRTLAGVANVPGHGVSAALLMTTVRALIRGRFDREVRLSAVVNDVNRLLCRDTGQTGNFMSLFFMTLDPVEGEVRWVRAGHDPAIVYDPRRDRFEELVGQGVVLRLNEAWNFEEQVLTGWTPDQLILVGTDGIWEAENPAGEMFGKERLRSILRRCHERPATMILQDIVDALGRFRNGSHQNDDITLVVIKAPGNVTNLNMSGT